MKAKSPEKKNLLLNLKCDNALNSDCNSPKGCNSFGAQISERK